MYKMGKVSLDKSYSEKDLVGLWVCGICRLKTQDDPTV